MVRFEGVVVSELERPAECRDFRRCWVEEQAGLGELASPRLSGWRERLADVEVIEWGPFAGAKQEKMAQN